MVASLAFLTQVSKSSPYVPITKSGSQTNPQFRISKDDFAYGMARSQLRQYGTRMLGSGWVFCATMVQSQFQLNVGKSIVWLHSAGLRVVIS